MNPGDYVAGFASILFGLAMGDLLLDLDRLLRLRQRVRWYPLPFVAALMIVIALLAGWWDLFVQLQGSESYRILDFLPLLAKFALLFLIAAATLPTGDEDTLDLKTYYFANARYLFGLWAILIAFITISAFVAHGAISPQASLFLGGRFTGFLILALSKRPLVHWIILPLLTASLTWAWIAAEIAQSA